MGFLIIPTTSDGETLRKSINVYQAIAFSKGYNFKITTGMDQYLIHESHDRYSGHIRLQIRFKVKIIN